MNRDSLRQQGATNEQYSSSVEKSGGFMARVAKYEKEFADRLRQAGHTAETRAQGFRDAGDFGATKGHFGFVVKDESGDAHAFVVAPALVPQVFRLMARMDAAGASEDKLLSALSDRPNAVIFVFGAPARNLPRTLCVRPLGIDNTPLIAILSNLDSVMNHVAMQDLAYYNCTTRTVIDWQRR